MELNKSYYMKLNDKLEIVSGETDHVAIDQETVELIKDGVQEHLSSGALFTGENLEIKEVKKFDISTLKTSTHKVVENWGNLDIGPEGKATIFEYNTQTRVLRIWIKHPDYKKKDTGDTKKPKLNAGGPEF